MSTQAAAQPAPATGHGAPAGAAAPEPEGTLSVRDAATRLELLIDDDGRSPGDGAPVRDEPKDGIIPVEDSDTDTDTDDEAPVEASDTDTDTDNDTPDSDDNDGGDDSEDGIDTVEALAEALEMDADAFNELNISFKAAGEDVTAPISELIKGYQKDSDYRKNTAVLADDRRAFNSQRQEHLQRHHQESTVLAAVMGQFEQQLVGQANSEEMARLRIEDPAEWNARVHEINGKKAALDQYRADASARYSQVTETAKIEFLKDQGAILQRDVPDWGQEKMQVATEAIKTFGYTDDEIPNIADARLMKAALEVDALRKENAALKAAAEKGGKAAARVKAEVPKISLKTGGGKGGKSVTRSGLAKAKARVKATAGAGGKANLNAAAEAIEHMLTSNP